MRRPFLAAILLAHGSAAFAADHVVVQKDRRFHPGSIAVAKGDTLTFTNDDEFIHQIFVGGPVFSFDTKEKVPGESDTETFTQSGTFEVHCHIHPKMKLVVTVR
jgi:plastocyanin